MNEILEKALHDLNIPLHMHGAIKRYIDDGLYPGGFLSAVLENDLKGAVAQADHLNLKALPDYVKWLYNYAPMGCWGYKGVVSDWIAYVNDTKRKDHIVKEQETHANDVT